MAWTFTADSGEFLDVAGDVLLADPVRHTISAVGMQRWRTVGAPEGSFFGWWANDQGAVVGAVSMNPPWPLLLDVVPEASLPELVSGLLAVGAEIPGVNAQVDLAVTFASMWAARTPSVAQLFMAMRLFELGDLNAPRRVLSDGTPRRADEGDLGLLVPWMNAFLEDIGESADDGEESIRLRLRTGEVWLWCVGSGEPVSMVGRTEPAAGVARVGPVYTPDARRGRGYAEMLTHVACEHALAEGLRLVLFADQANPTSTGIYRSLGFVPVQDRATFHFVG